MALGPFSAILAGVTKLRTLVARGLLAWFVLTLLPSLLLASVSLDSALVLPARASGPGGHGCKEGNLVPNCNMDNFVPVAQGQAPSGWTPYVLRGSLAMDPSPDTYWGAPSVRMWSDGDTFTAGLYTQVGGLTPGATYYASMGWGGPTPPEDSWGRRLGIDPTGGTDPNSPNIVWGPMQRGPGKVLNDSNPGYPNIDVSAVARGATATVFIWVDHNYSTGANEIFIDAVGLYQSAAPVVAVATATPPPAPTAPPATAAPAKPKATATKRPPTATTVPSRTPTPADTATAAPTDTPSPTNTPTVTPTATETLTPSVTPSSTLPARPRATVAPAATQVASVTEAPAQGLLFGGIAALAAAGLLGVVMLGTRSRKD